MTQAPDFPYETSTRLFTVRWRLTIAFDWRNSGLKFASFLGCEEKSEDQEIKLAKVAKVTKAAKVAKVGLRGFLIPSLLAVDAVLARGQGCISWGSKAVLRIE
jgi:hypothetical protein